ncbi:hypothetical protein IW261DRAFT_1514703 [Armillaria novae-zelandiae]|uniref:Uncharacterized protein n=1 Tax=Armillaria novae-zelandiae TaxID=153914 RepID=A0AA39NS16_9AGAR|nr:hypothetical protein IW261DRAFT_1514703 [Armillaria novae-zelandiae]
MCTVLSLITSFSFSIVVAILLVFLLDVSLPLDALLCNRVMGESTLSFMHVSRKSEARRSSLTIISAITLQL